MEATWYKENGAIYFAPEKVEVSIHEVQAVIANVKTATAEIRKDGNIYVTSADKDTMKLKMALCKASMNHTESLAFSGIRINSRNLEVSKEQEDFNVADMKKKGVR